MIKYTELNDKIAQCLEYNTPTINVGVWTVRHKKKLAFKDWNCCLKLIVIGY